MVAARTAFISGLLKLSVCALALGHLGVIRLCIKPMCSAYVLNSCDWNRLPLSLLMTLGIPNVLITLSSTSMVDRADTDFDNRRARVFVDHYEEIFPSREWATEVHTEIFPRSPGQFGHLQRFHGVSFWNQKLTRCAVCDTVLYSSVHVREPNFWSEESFCPCHPLVSFMRNIYGLVPQCFRKNNSCSAYTQRSVSTCSLPCFPFQVSILLWT
jgi:hypothetical protein